MRVFFFLWIVQGFAAFNLTWGIPAINLDSNPPAGDTDANASMAIDPSGNAVATWSRTTGKGASEDIWAAVYGHSSRVWTGAVKISGGGIALNSKVAIDSQGNAMFIWEEGFPTQIMCRMLSAEGVWAPPIDLPPTQVHLSLNAQVSPQIAVDGAGNAVAIWEEFSKGLYQIHAAKKNVPSSWIYLGALSSMQNNATINPNKALKLNEAGDGIAVWEEYNGVFSEIHGARYIKGSWTSSTSIASSEGENAHFAKCGIDANGNCTIVWNQRDQIRSKTWAQDTLSEATTISNPAYIAQRPDLEVDAEGNVVVVFERYDAMHKFISATTLPAHHQAWSSPVDISGPSPSSAAGAGYPVLSLNKIGNGVVIWKEFTGTNMIIQGAGYALGTWSYIKTLSSFEDNSGAPFPAYDIDVAVNSAGNIMAIWPEDPSKIGSQQIKTTTGVGLANLAPLPPMIASETVENGIAFGKQFIHRFPAHIDLFNVLEWSPRMGATQYKIYRGSFSNLIGTSTLPKFEDHQRPPYQKEIYLITSIDSNNQESSPITLVVQPLEKITKRK